jgi:hypothetical protein
MIFGLWKSVFVLHFGKNLLTILLYVSATSLACIDTTKFKGRWKESKWWVHHQARGSNHVLSSKPGKEERDPMNKINSNKRSRPNTTVGNRTIFVIKLDSPTHSYWAIEKAVCHLVNKAPNCTLFAPISVGNFSLGTTQELQLQLLLYVECWIPGEQNTQVFPCF